MLIILKKTIYNRTKESMVIHLFNKDEKIRYFEVNSYYSFILEFKKNKKFKIFPENFNEFLFDNDIDKLIKNISKIFDKTTLDNLKSTYISKTLNNYFKIENSKNLFGSDYTNTCIRKFLMPCYVESNKTKNKWIFPELIIFLNSYAFIKFNIPFENCTLQYFYENTSYKYFKSITLAVNQKTTFSSFEELFKYYTKLIEKKFHVVVNNTNSAFNQISLIDYDLIPNNHNQISTGLKEMAFCLLQAPVLNYNYDNLKQNIRDYFKKQKIDHGNSTSVIGPHGQCLTFLHNLYSQQQISDISNKQKQININSLTSSLLEVDIEFAILMNMLKHINYTIYFNERLNKDKLNTLKLNKIRENYNLNKLLLYHFLENSTESSINFYQQFEKRLYLYHNNFFYNEKSNVIDEIISDNFSLQNEHLQKMISFVNLILISLFGLPTIKDSFIIIKDAFFIKDIPYVTINSASIFSWIVCILLSIKFCKFKTRIF